GERDNLLRIPGTFPVIGLEVTVAPLQEIGAGDLSLALGIDANPDPGPIRQFENILADPGMEAPRLGTNRAADQVGAMFDRGTKQIGSPPEELSDLVGIADPLQGSEQTRCSLKGDLLEIAPGFAEIIAKTLKVILLVVLIIVIEGSTESDHSPDAALLQFI